MRTKEVMFPMIEAWERGDTTQRVFCEQHNLPQSVFQYWYHKYKEECVEQQELSPFISMEVTAAKGPLRSIQIRYPDGTQVNIAI